ncbi:hypothetical protein BKA82DRAFT_4347759 [Pisolithus tinctorius]|nr:hypothetical protein BKA82DRAFT_4347759 [Pisolithus tinctorius]
MSSHREKVRVPYTAQAHKCLVIWLSMYIAQVEDVRALGDLMKGMVNIFRKNKLLLEEKARLLLIFLWGLEARQQLHAEIGGMLCVQGVVKRDNAPWVTNLPALLLTDAHVLDGLSLPLLDLVIQETIQSTPLRQALWDAE